MALIGVAIAVLGIASSATGYVAEVTPEIECGAANVGMEDILARELGKLPSAATVGKPFTFTARSPVPLSFAVASSPSALAHPDIDAGTGAVVGGPEAGAQPNYTYAFTSSNATARAGTVYWQASYSDAGLKGCAGLPPRTIQSEVFALAVLAPPPAPPPPAIGPTEPSPEPVVVPPLSVALSAPVHLHLGSGVLTYSVECPQTCTGTSSLEVLEVRHGHAVAVRGLGLRPSGVDIADPNGGSQRVGVHLSVRVRQRLRRLLRSGVALRIAISTDVGDPEQQRADAHASIALTM